MHIGLLMLLSFLVDVFLLLGTNRLCGYPLRVGRCALGAFVGSVYAVIVCCLPAMRFLGSYIWRGVCLLLVGWISYGVSFSAVRRLLVFVLLSMALGGVALGVGDGGFWSVIGAAVCIFVLCAAGFRDKLGSTAYVPVKVCYGGKQLNLIALHDTGNTLSDPVSGKPVLIVDAASASALTGLTEQQLKNPVEALSEIGLPGLRLIPYHTVGLSAGFLLALSIPEVQIGKWKGSSLVAFSPNGLSRDGAYQALTGGTVW